MTVLIIKDLREAQGDFWGFSRRTGFLVKFQGESRSRSKCFYDLLTALEARVNEYVWFKFILRLGTEQ